MANSSSIQKPLVPKQLFSESTIHTIISTVAQLMVIRYIRMNTRTNKYIYIHLEYRDDITLIFNKYNNNDLIYFYIDIHTEHHEYSTTKMIYLRYSDESEKTILYEHTGPNGASSIIPLCKGWYVHKRKIHIRKRRPQSFKAVNFFSKN